MAFNCRRLITEEAELHSITRVYDVGDLMTVQNKQGNRWKGFDALIKAVTSTKAPESWENVGGRSSIAAMEFRGAVVLIVGQTHEVHEQIGEFTGRQGRQPIRATARLGWPAPVGRESL